MEALSVTHGQVVSVGQKLGEVGELGNASGCHLHFEVHPDGGSIYEDGIDPTIWLRENQGQNPSVIRPISQNSSSWRVATFNVLGHSHTTERGKHPDMASGPARTVGLVRLLDGHDIDIAGLQEFQGPQYDGFVRLAGDRYAVYHPPGDTENAVVWRRDRWTLVSGGSFEIPYFNGRERRMPVVRLRELATGKETVFITVHNPADTARFPHQAGYRDEAVSREIAVVQRLTASSDVPVFLTGDLNDRRDAFCRLTTSTDLKASNGGSNADACWPPEGAGIDWIFGTSNVRFLGHQVDRSDEVDQTSDHPMVITDAVDEGP